MFRDQEWLMVFTQAMVIIVAMAVLASLLTGCSYRLNRTDNGAVNVLPASKGEKSNRH